MRRWAGRRGSSHTPQLGLAGSKALRIAEEGVSRVPATYKLLGIWPDPSGIGAKSRASIRCAPAGGIELSAWPRVRVPGLVHTQRNQRCVRPARKCRTTRPLNNLREKVNQDILESPFPNCTTTAVIQREITQHLERRFKECPSSQCWVPGNRENDTLSEHLPRPGVRQPGSIGRTAVCRVGSQGISGPVSKRRNHRRSAACA